MLDAKKNSYLEFQHRLQELVSFKDGLSLALSSMVEVNVAGGILSKSETNKGKELLQKITNSDFVVATGVSEPKWEGQLKNLTSSFDETYKLTGVKSFVTNGNSANTILWVVPYQNKYSVFAVDVHSQEDKIVKEKITTPFASLASHLKIELTNYSLSSSDLVLEDYGKLGIELRLKELFSLVSLLLGFVNLSFSYGFPSEIKQEWESLSLWRDKAAVELTNENLSELLESFFPFPISPLLESLKHFHGLNFVSELVSIHPDYSLFIWEDGFTKYLTKRKNRSPQT